METRATRRRYPGTGPFASEDERLFFGRKSETEELYLRILSVPLMLQFGKSGLGKTSLLQAGLFPLLRERAFLPVMVRLNDAGESLTAAVERSLLEAIDNERLEGIDFEIPDAAGLWELLSGTTIWRDDLLLTPVLVFDQFEEVFTLRDQKFRDELASEIGALITGDAPDRVEGIGSPDVKLLISLREDYVGALEQFSAAIPGLFHERLRLEPLSEKNAREAVIKPAALEAREGETPYWTKPFSFDEVALKGMMTYLKGRSGVIEPFQLQLLCRHAEGIAKRKESKQSAAVELTMNDFRGSDAFAAVLDNFYRDVLARIASPLQRRRAARLCEEGLLGSAGQRLMLEQKQIAADYRVSAETLDVLTRERLVRGERRGESMFYELSHDRLAEAVFAVRGVKLPKAFRRALWVAVPVAILVVAGLLFWTRTINEERKRTERERDSAEKLVGFLLGEQFLGEVRDMGRSTLLAQVQKEVDRPGAGARTSLNRGLALRNRGEIERTNGNVAASVQSFHQALEVFENAPDHPDAMREIARTHDLLSSAYGSQGKVNQALAQIESAVRAWRKVARRQGDPEVVRSDCLSLADSLTSEADLKRRIGNATAALADLETSTAALTEVVFGRSRAEAPAQCARMGNALAPYPDAKALEILSRVSIVRAFLFFVEDDFEGAAVAGAQARMLRPPSISARRSAMIALAQRGHMRVFQSPQAAFDDYRRALAEFEELRRWDPDNRAWQRDRAVVQFFLSEGITYCNERPEATCVPRMTLDDAEAMILDSIATFRSLASLDPSNVSLRDDLNLALRVHANIVANRPGQGEERLAILREAQRVHDQTPHDPSDTAQIYGAALARNLEADALLALDRAAEAEPVVRRAVHLASQLVAAHPDNAMYQYALATTWARDVALARNKGDAQRAAKAEEESRAAMQQFSELRANYSKQAEDDLARGTSHITQGAKLYQAKSFEEAAREFTAAESAFRHSIQRRPVVFEGYDSLGNAYHWLQLTYGELGRKQERIAALGAAMHAAQMAAWLSTLDNQTEMNKNVLYRRNHLGRFLIDEGSFQDALGLVPESVVTAEALAQREPAVADYRFSLGLAKCAVGLVRIKLGKPGWEEAIRSGLIDFKKATELDPKSAFYQVRIGWWRETLAEELEKKGRRDEAASELALALRSFEEAAKLEPQNADAQRGITNLRGRIGR